MLWGYVAILARGGKTLVAIYAAGQVCTASSLNGSCVRQVQQKGD